MIQMRMWILYLIGYHAYIMIMKHWLVANYFTDSITNPPNIHWLTCSTIGCEPGVVNIFDSMSGKDLPTRAKEQITSLVCTPLKQGMLRFMRVQRQN